MKSNETPWLESNRAIWEKRAASHVNSDFYDVKSFLEGKSSLNKFELDLLGDVKGKTLLHLQCHFGQDTLSLARMGAKVTGVDFSENAIEAARKLNEQLQLDAKFIACNVYDTRKHTSETFDIVFTSYGTIGWLPDLKPWAKVVSESLKPGGKFVLVDFHPYVWMLDEEFHSLKYSYFNDEVIETESTGSYASPKNLHAPMKEYGWNHPLTDTFTALINEGLQLEAFKEYNESPYNCFPGMEQTANGMFRFTEWGNKIPLVYAIVSRKP